MELPVVPPVAPMLARPVRDLPEGEDLRYEPKWDGFRCIVFRDGDEVVLGSRNERPLTRYFPELVSAAVDELPPRCVLDGEIVIAGPRGLDFEALLQRIHPAESRVRRLAADTPASFVGFDLLCLDHRDLRGAPFVERREELEHALADAGPDLHLTRQTRDLAEARRWFSRFEGAGLDGVVAKDPSLPYREGARTMWKVKHERTADCVVGGFRWHKQSGVGSLLLGLYDHEGVLHHVGVCSSFGGARRVQLEDELGPLRQGDDDEHPWRHPDEEPPAGRVPEPQSRWSAGRDLSWEPLRPERVCEVAYDHLQGDRFRHATAFRRWRPDRVPTTCTYDQLEVAVPVELSEVWGVSR